MKSVRVFALILFSSSSFAQITYVDNFDAVYPFTSGANNTYNFDLNSDGEIDVAWRNTSTGSTTCGIYSGTQNWGFFGGLINLYGQNKVNASATPTDLGIDCTGDTLDVLDLWNNTARVYHGVTFPDGLCQNIGYGNHKQGVRMLKEMPTGGLGYLYGYIDYTLTNNGDLIIHGWYYEETFNVPIAANSLLEYPYDGNCIVYDTVLVYDTTYTSVTDTLYINVSQNNFPTNYLTTIKVFPNPTSTILTVNNGNFSQLTNYELKLEDELGSIVFESIINQADFTINISTLATGTYFLSIIDDNAEVLTIRKVVLN